MTPILQMLFLLRNSSQPPPPEKLDHEDKEESVDVWGESWVRDRTLNE